MGGGQYKEGPTTEKVIARDRSTKRANVVDNYTYNWRVAAIVVVID